MFPAPLLPAKVPNEGERHTARFGGPTTRLFLSGAVGALAHPRPDLPHGGLEIRPHRREVAGKAERGEQGAPGIVSSASARSSRLRHASRPSAATRTVSTRSLRACSRARSLMIASTSCRVTVVGAPASTQAASIHAATSSGASGWRVGSPAVIARSRANRSRCRRSLLSAIRYAPSAPRLARVPRMPDARLADERCRGHTSPCDVCRRRAVSLAGKHPTWGAWNGLREPNLLLLPAAYAAIPTARRRHR